MEIKELEGPNQNRTKKCRRKLVHNGDKDKADKSPTFKKARISNGQTEANLQRPADLYTECSQEAGCSPLVDDIPQVRWRSALVVSPNVELSEPSYINASPKPLSSTPYMEKIWNRKSNKRLSADDGSLSAHPTSDKKIGKTWLNEMFDLVSLIEDAKSRSPTPERPHHLPISNHKFTSVAQKKVEDFRPTVDGSIDTQGGSTSDSRSVKTKSRNSSLTSPNIKNDAIESMFNDSMWDIQSDFGSSDMDEENSQKSIRTNIHNGHVKSVGKRRISLDTSFGNKDLRDHEIATNQHKKYTFVNIRGNQSKGSVNKDEFETGISPSEADILDAAKGPSMKALEMKFQSDSKQSSVTISELPKKKENNRLTKSKLISDFPNIQSFFGEMPSLQRLHKGTAGKGTTKIKDDHCPAESSLKRVSADSESTAVTKLIKQEPMAHIVNEAPLKVAIKIEPTDCNQSKEMQQTFKNECISPPVTNTSPLSKGTGTPLRRYSSQDSVLSPSPKISLATGKSGATIDSLSSQMDIIEQKRKNALSKLRNRREGSLIRHRSLDSSAKHETNENLCLQSLIEEKRRLAAEKLNEHKEMRGRAESLSGTLTQLTPPVSQENRLCDNVIHPNKKPTTTELTDSGGSGCSLTVDQLMDQLESKPGSDPAGPIVIGDTTGKVLKTTHELHSLNATSVNTVSSKAELTIDEQTQRTIEQKRKAALEKLKKSKNTLLQ